MTRPLSTDEDLDAYRERLAEQRAENLDEWQRLDEQRRAAPAAADERQEGETA
jgi:hypothetical protein